MLQVLRPITVLIGFIIFLLSTGNAFSQYDPERILRALSIEQQNNRFQTQSSDLSQLCTTEIPQKDSPELINYNLQNAKRLMEAWDNNLQFLQTQPVVMVTINRRGQLVEGKLLRSSNDTELNNKLLVSLNQAFPLPPAPPSERRVFSYVLTPQIIEFYRQNSSNWNADFFNTLQEDYDPIERNWSKQLVKFMKGRIKHSSPIEQSIYVLVRLVVNTKTGELLEHKIIKNSCDPTYDAAIEEAFQGLQSIPTPEKPGVMEVMKVTFMLGRNKTMFEPDPRFVKPYFGR